MNLSNNGTRNKKKLPKIIQNSNAPRLKLRGEKNRKQAEYLRIKNYCDKDRLLQSSKVAGKQKVFK
jgi:hypothetical protein